MTRTFSASQNPISINRVLNAGLPSNATMVPIWNGGSSTRVIALFFQR
ncbi:uncharacterized protein METZ01_LOCUS313338, partial [marine metagenome]